MATVEFGFPQGSILGPVIFNLQVADLQSELKCDCYQHGDDTTFYIHSKPRNLHSSADHINKAVTSLGDYSKSCNLAFKSSKTNWMLHPTAQFTKTSYRRWQHSTKTDLLYKAIGCTRGPAPDLEDACRPCVKFIVQDTVSTAGEGLKIQPPFM